MDVNNLSKEEINSVRAWFVDRMENAFIVADSSMCFIDANESAKKIFPRLRDLSGGDTIPSDMQFLFTEKEENIDIGERKYAKIISERWGDQNYICVSLHDRTDEFRLEKDLELARANAEESNITRSVFLSNMSHEIRTPMNAIVGMSDILLREELPSHTKEYLNNIKGSVSTLLSIINDILDISEIEEGTLKIIEEEYDPMSFLNDLGMIFLNKIGEKPVELLYQIDPDLPERMTGDFRRIQQIIINMMNNAVEYTDTGFICLTMSVVEKGDDYCVLSISVTDSGTGIREEDKGDLFCPFQTISNRKRDENEGLGLGLSICKQLVKLMGGEIGVESTYGTGSRFYFTLSQGIVSSRRAAELKEQEKKREVYYTFENVYLEENLLQLADEYGIETKEFDGTIPEDGEGKFIFTDDPDRIGNKLLSRMKDSGVEICVLHNPMRGSRSGAGYRTVNKPLYSLNFCQILNDDQTTTRDGRFEMDFTAPDVRILIVDDNEMNIQVAKGLLAPLNMHIDTAENGMEGVEMAAENDYDIIFMDHMMPVMDGVEATERIRQLPGVIHEDMPIIALSANATAEAEVMFREKGFTDFLAKPVKIRELTQCLLTWLPEYRIKRGVKPKASPMFAESDEDMEIPSEIEGLDVPMGIEYCGSPVLFHKCLVIFYKIIDKNSSKIKKFLEDGLIRDYTIEVHALKNSARMIGAQKLSDDFKELEQMGNDEDLDGIMEKTPGVLDLYLSYKEILKPFAESDKKNSYVPTKEEVTNCLEKIKEAMDSFDMDGADEAMGVLSGYALPEGFDDRIMELDALVSDFAMEDVIQLCEELIAECDAVFEN